MLSVLADRDDDESEAKRLKRIVLISFCLFTVSFVGIGIYGLLRELRTCSYESPLWMFAFIYLLCPWTLGMVHSIAYACFGICKEKDVTIRMHKHPTSSSLHESPVRVRHCFSANASTNATIQHLLISSLYSLILGTYGYIVLESRHLTCDRMRPTVLFQWCTVVVYWSLGSGLVFGLIGVASAVAASSWFRRMRLRRKRQKSREEDRDAQVSNGFRGITARRNLGGVVGYAAGDGDDDDEEEEEEEEKEEEEAGLSDFTDMSSPHFPLWNALGSDLEGEGGGGWGIGKHPAADLPFSQLFALTSASLGIHMDTAVDGHKAGVGGAIGTCAPASNNKNKNKNKSANIGVGVGEGQKAAARPRPRSRPRSTYGSTRTRDLEGFEEEDEEEGEAESLLP
jgi:hypothetical protein